jgi:hypothetical protein
VCAFGRHKESPTHMLTWSGLLPGPFRFQGKVRNGGDCIGERPAPSMGWLPSAQAQDRVQ